MRRSFLAWTLVLATFGVPPAAGQNEVMTPRSYALTNARIVVSPGNVIENGTVVIRDGRIVAAGANAQVPAGVIPLNLAGATVYAGLIDAANGAGLPAIAQGGRGGGGGGAAEPASGPPPELNPGLNAADAFTPGADLLASYRSAGVTTVGLAFDGGIFPGRVSAVSTRDGAPASLVERSPVAQQVAFGRKRGGYPSTLMGALAYIEQSFKDARYDARVKAAFEASPGTAPLPPYDPEHEALQPAAAGSMPVWFAASGAYDIERAIDLASRLGIEDYAIVGAQEAFKIAPQVQAAGVPLIVSVDFPNPNQMSGRVFELHVAPVSGEDTADEQADSAAAHELRGNAAALAAAGVPFALAGNGTSPAEFRSRIRTLVEEGLSADAALRAVTVTPAQILGLGGALGTVEAGKWANLVVANGDLFAENTRILQVFVQGEKYDIPAPTAAGGRGGRGGGAGGPGGGAPVAVGEWNGSLDMQGNSMGFTLTITGQNDALSATIGTEMGSTAMRGSMDGSDLMLRGIFESPDGQFQLLLNARITGSEMSGTIDVEGMGVVTLTARRGGSADRMTAIKDGGVR